MSSTNSTVLSVIFQSFYIITTTAHLYQCFITTRNSRTPAPTAFSVQLISLCRYRWGKSTKHNSSSQTNKTSNNISHEHTINRRSNKSISSSSSIIFRSVTFLCCILLITNVSTAMPYVSTATSSATTSLLLSSSSYFATSPPRHHTHRRGTVAFAMSPPSAQNRSPSNEDVVVEKSCAVIGVGVLGVNLCKQLLSSADCTSYTKIYGITRTTDRHEQIQEQIGSSSSANDRFQLLTADEYRDQHIPKCTSVIFCAPPSGFVNYPQALQDAVTNYLQGPNTGGVFLFTSSGAVYGDVAGVVTETSPVADAQGNARIERLVDAENIVLKAGGSCLRLAGLYDLTRGAHNYWITSGKAIAASPDGLINLVHYDDAASACLAALVAGPSVSTSQIFLISDNHPVSRYDICAQSLKARVYQNYSLPSFVAPESTDKRPEQPWARGKVYDGSYTMKVLHWQPKYPSFGEFMEQHS